MKKRSTFLDEEGISHKILDHTGKSYGKLKAIKFIRINKWKRAEWYFVCECGNVGVFDMHSVVSGKRKSCNCALEDHGFAKYGNYKRLYTIWQNIIQRCTNPKNDNYHYYGERGIQICSEWRDFKNFLRDMGEPPSLKHTIDRKNNNGNYEKDNCRWVTRDLQNLNKSSNKKYHYKDDFLTLKELVEKHSKFKYNTVLCRLNRGWSISKALKFEINEKCWKISLDNTNF